MRILRPAAAVLVAAAATATLAASRDPARDIPPQVDPARDFSLSANQPWARAEAFVSRLDFTSGASERARVRVCAACAPVDVTVAPERRVVNLSTDAFPEGMRVVMRLVRHEPVAAPTLGFPANAASDTSYMVVTSPTQARVMYRDAAGHIAFSQPWRFMPHPDEHVWTSSAARWRAEEGTGGVEAGGLSFVWMTCAAGCCQFHGSPPDGSPAQAAPAAR